MGSSAGARFAGTGRRRSLGLYVVRSLMVTECNETAVAQVSICRPLDEFELREHLRLDPQCRIPDYAEYVQAGIVLTALRFSVFAFGMITLSFHVRAGADPYGHAADRQNQRVANRCQAGATFLDRC